MKSFWEFVFSKGFNYGAISALNLSPEFVSLNMIVVDIIVKKIGISKTALLLILLFL
jgi:hypothetical protein